jgi:hypothetical protein
VFSGRDQRPYSIEEHADHQHRAEHHRLAAVPVGQRAPDRPHHRATERPGPDHQAGPERGLGHVGHAEVFVDVLGDERLGQVERDVRQRYRRHDDVLVTLPRFERLATQPLREP